MITVSKSKLKSRMLEYFRELENGGDGIIVTHNRQPVLRITPIKERKSTKEIFGDIRGNVSFDERELLEPVTEEWTDI